ncbi:hypothetical protein GCM10009735_45200 [Actinomadura chokoriensis]
MVAPVEDEHAQAEPGRAAFGDREPEEPGTGHHEINVHWTVSIPCGEQRTGPHYGTGRSIRTDRG